MIPFASSSFEKIAMFLDKVARYWLMIATVSAIFMWTAVVGAHTEGPMQLASVPAGPYKITVWSSPDPALVGEVHVALAVTLAEDASPVLDADVQVIFKSTGDGSTISAPATTENSENKFLYEAITDIKESGPYQVIISIDADEGSGEVSFKLEVEPDSGVSWYLIVVAVVIGAGLLYWGWRRRSVSADGKDS